MTYLGSWKIDDPLTFSVNTHSPTTGAETDADSVPTYRLYEDETTTPILTGSMAKLDDANTTGYYSEQITLSAANGFEKGKSYNVRITAVVGTVTGSTARFFQIEAEVDSNVVSGAVPSVTGNVGGNVVGTVASVVGNVAGSVVGSVGSVLGGVAGSVGSVIGDVGGNVVGSIGTLSATALASIWNRLTSALTTAGSIGKLIVDNLDATISSRSSHSAADVWAAGTRTLTSFGTLVADIWASATRTLTAISDSAGITTLLSRLTSGRATNLDNLDAAISTRLATVGYTTPPTVTQIRQEMDTNSADLDAIIAGLITVLANIATVDGKATAIKVVTDILNGLIENVSGNRYTAKALEQGPGGGGGTTYLYGTDGPIEFEYTVFKPGGSIPLAGCSVYVSSDIAGTNRSDRKVTDSVGKVTFNLYAATVYFWRSHPSYTFTDPDTEVVS